MIIKIADIFINTDEIGCYYEYFDDLYIQVHGKEMHISDDELKPLTADEVVERISGVFRLHGVRIHELTETSKKACECNE